MGEFEGIYRSGNSPKRREEVRERLRAGMDTKRIAADLGIAPHAVEEIADGLRAEGSDPAEAPTTPG